MSWKAKKTNPESADKKENPFEKYRGTGNLGIGSGREAVLRYCRELRGYDEYDELIAEAYASGPFVEHTKDDIESAKAETLQRLRRRKSSMRRV